MPIDHFSFIVFYDMAYFLCDIDPKKGYSALEGPIRVAGEEYESLLHYFSIHHRCPVDYELMVEAPKENELASARKEV